MLTICRNYFCYLLIVFTVLSCATISGKFSAQLAVAYSTLTGVRQTTLTLLDQKRITREDAIKVQNAANNVRGLLDIAQEFVTLKDEVSAMGKLEEAQTMLNEIATFLKVKETTP